MPAAPANPVGGILKSLPMHTMFAAPIEAAIKTHTMACKSVASFIDEVGMTDKGEVRMVRFAYKEAQIGEDGEPTGTIMDRSVDIPFIATVPLPALGVELVTVDFDLEVSTSEASSSQTESKGSFTAKVGWGWFSASMSGSVSHKSEQTRKTDTRAKYTVHLEARKQEPPEALMRVIDFLTNAATKPLPAAKAPPLPVDGGADKKKP
ncbi:MAG TPA: DUF2589 domain-containing protein [Phycisphaerae bacterium]|nr:DUF2589 domain-containing protein [Phycisphaerae bacterium]